MSDSFADLWNSTGASKPAEQPRKLGSLAPVVPPSRNAKNDVFSMLASSGPSSSPASRSGTPGATGPVQSTRSMGMSGTSSPMTAKPIQKSTSSGGDAFSGLLSGSLASRSTANRANMTMAERAAHAERERREQMQQNHTVARQAANAWAGLDSLGEFAASPKPSAPAQTSVPEDDDWLFGSESEKPSVSHAKVASTKSPSPPKDDWGLDDFISQPAAPKPTSAQPSGQSLLDLDEFNPIPATHSSRASSQPPAARSNTPGDFDFGDREDGLLDNQSDDDDILGELGKPVSQRRPPQSTQPGRATPSPQSVPSRSGLQSRAVSPPPHILGKIVEMGFSVEQARVALASTDTGLDVEAALETLLANAGASESTPREPPRADGRWSQHEPGHERYYESDEEQAAPSRRRPAPTPRSSASGRSREPPSRNGASPSGETQRNLQEQADKLISQASEIGLSMFNRANAFWKEGKEKAMKAYEERAAASRQATPPSKNGRPKWMQDAPEGEIRDEEWTDGAGGFRNDHEILPPKPVVQTRPKPSEARLRPAEPEPQSAASRIKTGNLLSDDAPAVYTSPWRRKTPSRSQAPTPPSQPAASTSRAQPPPRPPSPIKLAQRKTVSAPPAAIAASAKHKAAGTEMFKLGRYAEAETSYTSAIATLPESHLLLVPLFNNRALARIKTGDHAGAIDDATAVITLIGPSYHPAREAKVTREDEGAGVDLADALVKAFWRRAEAYEGREKWDAARQDWETIAGADFAGKARIEAVKGVGRCRKMLSAGADGASSIPAPPLGSAPAPAARPVPKPRPRPTPAVVVPTEAVDRVREANQAAEAEAQAKHELKDVVDAKLAAWKNGKEANIRALIASLDTVLWPELGWQKVGMHELVTPSQVKIRYTKAIAKLHPDKLNAKNTTLEQRMIANGVFGSLNDAWNAFKQ
ncbi:hypothetical protein DAEQUDRAFT_756423 [Daedalea quercina L-15889]|uniref:UBA domain-containing protein n=1 Tax=Daedalea quercina L-15889 TaxID=1314783 RepID=A0A165R3H7_9APHY|nr:hypothetical protein DAEQUDRAFT_756423 [Daedalea quercina L-15889]